MTRYAVDPHRRHLVGVSSTPAGEIVSDVVSLESVQDDSLHHQLASALTELTSALWRTYTDPASGAFDDLSFNSEGWHRESEREAFAQIGQMLRQPNLPEQGSPMQSYIGTEEAAHQAGRVVHTIGSPDITDAIVQEIQEEIDAIEQAELGVIGGRSAQALQLTRTSASPVHVAAALELFDADPFGSRDLHELVDPTTASVAATYWLLAAAKVSAELSGTEPQAVILEADDIAAVPVETPTEVLGRLAAGDDPFDIVVDLIRTAMAVADGYAVAPLREPVMFPLHDTNADGHTRLTFLDPRRPAPNLLEDLLAGIHAAYLVWAEYSDHIAAPDEDATDDEWETYDRRRRKIFAEHVRQVARDHISQSGLTP